MKRRLYVPVLLAFALVFACSSKSPPELPEAARVHGADEVFDEFNCFYRSRNDEDCHYYQFGINDQAPDEIIEKLESQLMDAGWELVELPELARKPNLAVRQGKTCTIYGFEKPPAEGLSEALNDYETAISVMVAECELMLPPSIEAFFQFQVTDFAL